MKLDKIRLSDVQETINQIVDDRHFCKSTCLKLISFIKRVFKFAVLNRDITFSPVDGNKFLKVPIYSKKEKKIQPLSSSEYEAILTLLDKSPRLKPIVYCMLYGGLRIGEVLALTWEDIDLDNNLIHIHHSVRRYENPSGENKKYHYEIGDTKTPESVRDVPMCRELVKCVRIWKMLQSRYALDKTGMNLAFPKRTGLLQDSDSFDKAFRHFLNKNAVDPKKYHSRVFRHTFASYLAKRDVKPKQLQVILGHTDISTTMNYYVDDDVESQKQIVGILDDIIGDISDNSFSFINIERSA